MYIGGAGPERKSRREEVAKRQRQMLWKCVYDSMCRR